MVHSPKVQPESSCQLGNNKMTKTSADRRTFWECARIPLEKLRYPKTKEFKLGIYSTFRGVYCNISAISYLRNIHCISVFSGCMSIFSEPKSRPKVSPDSPKLVLSRAQVLKGATSLKIENFINCQAVTFLGLASSFFFCIVSSLKS